MASPKTKEMNAKLAALFTPTERWVVRVNPSMRRSNRAAGIRTTDHREVIAAMKMMKLVEAPPKKGIPQSVRQQDEQRKAVIARSS